MRPRIKPQRRISVAELQQTIRETEAKLATVTVLWLKPVHGRFGMETERIQAKLIVEGECFATVDVAGQRYAVPVEQLWPRVGHWYR